MISIGLYNDRRIPLSSCSMPFTDALRSNEFMLRSVTSGKKHSIFSSEITIAFFLSKNDFVSSNNLYTLTLLDKSNAAPATSIDFRPFVGTSDGIA